MMSIAHQVLAGLRIAQGWISLDDLARGLDVERVDVRAALLMLYSRNQVEPEGDRWRAVGGTS